MDILRFETDLVFLLERSGWIQSVEHDRQDFHIEWTPHGLESGERFIEEVRALEPEREWVPEDLDHLRSFGIYVGFIEATRRDRTIAVARPFTKSRNLLVISSAASGHRRYRLFTACAFEGFHDYLEAENDANREVMLISISDVLESNVGRAFPFGVSAQGEGRTIWRRDS